MGAKEDIDLLEEWSNAYYAGEPLVTDNEFDNLVNRVRAIATEREVKRLDKMVSDHSQGFKKANHISPMWSMKDIFNVKEADKWMSDTIKKITDITPDEQSGEAVFSIEPKWDGLPINLLYKNGKLVSAITRGDGKTGDDVTANAKVVRGVPLKISIKYTIEIRGEVMMSKTTFKEINKDRESKGEVLLSNPRNSASGSLKQKNSIVTASRKLDFYPWGAEGEYVPDSQTEVYNLFKINGFNNPLFKLSGNVDYVIGLYNDISKDRYKFDLEIDGLAIKVEDRTKWDALGVVGKYPKYQFAFKFPATELTTRILSITDQVGKTGIITPVAEVTPINIDGVTVSRATLHNYDEVKRLGIRIGDTVVIIRSGDVIPKILRVQTSSRTGKEIKINKPKTCPSCESTLVDMHCVNDSCPDTIIHKLLHFVSRDRFNIIGMGPAVIEDLVMNHNVTTYADIFSLDTKALSHLGKKTASTLSSNIRQAKHINLEILISSIGIPNVGRRAAKAIVSAIGKDWTSATYDDLINIKGIGKVMASDIIEFLKDNKDMVYSLLSIVTLDDDIKNVEDGVLDGKTYVITGTLTIPRNTLKENIEKLGGTVSSNISKHTSLLICGKNAGSKKTNAIKYGVTVFDASDKSLSELISSIMDSNNNPF